MQIRTHAARALAFGLTFTFLNACSLFNFLSQEENDTIDSRHFVGALLYEAQNSQASSSDGPVLFHAHSNDFSNYTLDWIEAGPANADGVPDMTLFTGRLTVSGTGGIKSAQIYNNRLIFISSAGSGNGSLLVYDKTGSTKIAELVLGTFPQEMVISGSTAYVTIQGTFSAADGQIKVVDLSNVDSPTLTQTITASVPQDPGDLVLLGNNLYVQKEGETGVDIFDISNNFSQTNMGTGASPLRLVYSGSKLFLVGSGGGGNLTTFTGAGDATAITAFPDTDNNATNEAPVFGSYLAFTDSTGYITLSDNSSFPYSPIELFTIDPGTGAIASTATVANVDHDFIGTGQRGNYFHRVTNGDGSATELTIEVQSMTGTVLHTFTVTKASDYSFMAF